MKNLSVCVAACVSLLVFLSCTPVPASAEKESCLLNVNLLRSDATLWKVLDAGRLKWKMKKQLSSLGDGLSVHGSVVAKKKEETTPEDASDDNDKQDQDDESDDVQSSSITKLSFALHCALPTEHLEEYGIEVTVAADQVHTPDHAHLTLTANPIIDAKDNGLELEDIEAKLVNQNPTLKTVPYQYNLARASLSPRIKSVQFILQFNDLIALSPKNFISVVLYHKNNDLTKNRLVLKEPAQIFFGLETIIPVCERVLEQDQAEEKEKQAEGAASVEGGDEDVKQAEEKPADDIKSAAEPDAQAILDKLSKLHWQVSTENADFFQDPFVTFLEENVEDYIPPLGAFEISVKRRDDLEQSVEGSFTMQSFHAIDKYEPDALRLTAQVFILNLEDGNPDRAPTIEFNLGIEAMSEKLAIASYVASNATYTVSAEEFPILSTEILKSVPDLSSYMPTSGQWQTVNFLVPVPDDAIAMSLMMKIDGKDTYLARVRNVQVLPASFVKTKAIPVWAIALIVVSAFLFVFSAFIILYRRKQSRRSVVKTLSESQTDLYKATTSSSLNKSVSE